MSTVQNRSADKRRLELYAAQQRAAEIAIASLLNPTLSPEALVAGNAVGLVGEDPMYQQLAAREQEQTGFLGGLANAFDEAIWDPVKGATRWTGLLFEGAMDEVFSRPIRTAANMTSHGMGLEEAYAESGGAFMGGYGESLERTWDALGEGRFQEALGFKGNVANMSEGIFASSKLAPEVQYQLANIEANGETVGTDRDLTSQWGQQNYGNNFAKLSTEQRKMMYLSSERDRIYQEASTEGTELYSKQSSVGSPYVDAHRREAESVLSYTPEIGTKYGTSGVGTFSQVSPGRSIAMVVTEPGTKPYHYLSGGIDFFVQMFGDPADVGLSQLSKASAASRALGVSNEAIRTAQDNARIMDTLRETIKGYEETELVELAAKHPETQKYADILAGQADVTGKGSVAEGRKELQRLGRARTEANRLTKELRDLEIQPDLTTVVKREMGLLDGAPRKDVDPIQVSKWITGRTAVPFVDNFVRAKSLREVDALLSYVKTPIPRKLRQALVDAETNAEVVGLLLPHVGNVITESGLAAVPSLTGGRIGSPTGLLAKGIGLINPTVSAREAAYYANQGFRANNKMLYGGSALARRFSLVAPSTMDLNDLDKAYEDLNLLSDNLGTTSGETLTYKVKGKEVTESLDDIMGDFINVRDGDFVGAYDVLTRYMRYSFEHLSASGLNDAVAEALVRFTGNMKDDALWFTNRVGDIVREPNAVTRTSVGTTEVINPGPQLITELFNGTVTLPDHNLIRRAVNDTDKFGRIMNNLALQGNPFRGIPGVKYTKTEIDDFNQRWALRFADSVLSTVWKPLVLLRFAWPFRVIGEEQIRLSAAGLGGMFTVAPGSGHHPLSYIAMALGDAGRKDGDVALRHLDVLGDDITKAEEFLAAQSRRVNFDGEIGAKGDRYWTTIEKYDSAGNVSGAYLDGLATELNQLWSDPVVQRLFLDDDAAFDAARTRALSRPSAPELPKVGDDGVLRLDRAGFEEGAVIEGVDTIEDVTQFRESTLSQGQAIFDEMREKNIPWKTSKEVKLADDSWATIKTADVEGVGPIAIAVDERGKVIGVAHGDMGSVSEAREGAGVFKEILSELRDEHGLTEEVLANMPLSPGAAGAGRAVFPKAPSRLADAVEPPRKLGPRTGGYDTRPAVLPMDDLLDMREFDRAADAALHTDGLPKVQRSADSIAYWRDQFEGKTSDEIFTMLGEADLPVLQMDYHGNVVLIEGNHRLAAAAEAGLTEFPVRMVTVRTPSRNLVAEAGMDTSKLPVRNIDDIAPGSMDRLREQYPGFKSGAEDTYVPADISPGDVFTPQKAAPVGEAKLSEEALARLEFHREQIADLEIDAANDIGETEGVFIRTKADADEMDADLTGTFDEGLDILPFDEQIAYHQSKVDELTAEAPSVARQQPSVPTEAPAPGTGTTVMPAPRRTDQDRIAATAEWLNTDEGSYWLRELTRTAPDEYKELLDTPEGLIRYLEGVNARAHLKAGGEYRFLLGDGTYIDDAGNPGRLTAQEAQQYGNRDGYVITRQGDQRLLDAYGTGKLDAATDKPLNVRRRFTGSDAQRKDAISEAQTLTDIRKVKEQLRNIVNDEVNAGVQFPTAVKTNRYLQDDIASISSTYDNVVNRMFDWFMSRPTNRLSRSPAFRSSYWQRMGDLMPHMDETLKAEVLAAAKKAKMDTIMMGNRGSVRRGAREAAGRGVEGGTISSLEDADKLAKSYALTEVQDILYDLSKKHNISEAMSIIFPFIEAYGEVSSTWAKLMTQEWGRPFRRFQQTIEGGRESNMFDSESGYTNNGFFHQDQYGKEVFSASFPIPFIGEMEGQFDYSLEGMNFLASVIPGFGPAVQIPANLFLPKDAHWDHIRELITPFGGADGNIVSSSMPSYMKRTFMAFEAGRSLLGSDNDQRMFENTVIDIMRAQAIADPEGFKIAMADPVENAKLLSKARSDARNLYLIRSLSTFMGPTSPSFTPMAEDKDGRMWAYNALASMYYQLKEEADGDELKATERFDELFGLDPMPLATGKTREILPRSSIKLGNQFQRNNPDLFSQYPATAFFLGPAGLEEAGEFYYPAYYQQIVDGAREDLSQQEWTGLVNDFYGEVAYDKAKKRVMETEGVFDSKDISDAGKNTLRDYNIKLQQDFPGYQYSFGANVTGVPSRVDRSEQISQITKMTQSEDLLSGYEAVRGAKEYLVMRDAALGAMRSLEYANLTSSESDKAVAVRSWLRLQGDKYSKLYPEFAPMWDGIFMIEIEEKRDTIDYDLVLQQVAGGG